MDQLIYLDIETIPTQRAQHVNTLRADAQADMEDELAQVKAPGNVKDPDKIAEAIERKRAEIQDKAAAALDEAYRKTALNGAFGQVVCCSIAVNDHPPLALCEEDWMDPMAETRLLQGINQVLTEICGNHRGHILIGHNIIGFDRKFLRQRGIVNGVRMHPLLTREVKPWDTGIVFDTMVAWSGDIRDRVSMNTLCAALGLDGKGADIDGSRVWDYVKAGRLAEVVAYCDADVIRTREIYKRLMFLGVTQPQPEEAIL